MNQAIRDRELEEAKVSFAKKDFRIENDVLIWNSNDRHPMNDLMERWLDLGLVTDVQFFATEVARDESNALFFAEYREAQKSRTPEQIAEERFNALAAMGPNVDMVNIVTGEKFNTSEPVPTEKVVKPARKGSKKEIVAKIIEFHGLSNRKEIIETIMIRLGVTKANAGVYIYNYKKANNI